MLLGSGLNRVNCNHVVACVCRSAGSWSHSEARSFGTAGGLFTLSVSERGKPICAGKLFHFGKFRGGAYGRLLRRRRAYRQRRFCTAAAYEPRYACAGEPSNGDRDSSGGEVPNKVDANNGGYWRP